jgi:hypothetical protein
MSYEPSGEGGTGITTRSEVPSPSRIDDPSGGNLWGYMSFSSTRYVPHTTSPSALVGGVRDHSTKSAPARRDALRRGLAGAKEAAASMESHAQTGELIDLSLSGFRLRDSLEDLWELRSEREDDWGDLLNILQGALRLEEFEKFSSEQCCAVYTIVADHLGSGTVGIDDIEQSLKLLRGADLDPWKGISGKLDSDED